MVIGMALVATHARAQTETQPGTRVPDDAAPAASDDQIAEPAPADSRPVPPPPPPRYRSSDADASPDKPLPPAKPAIGVETPAPVAQPLRAYRTHDGFYLRLALGLGSAAMSVDPKDTTLASLSAASGVFGFDALVGGTPARGLALGGALLVTAGTASGMDVSGRPTNEHATLTSGILGAFVDGFPDIHGGLHFGGALGLASATYQSAGSSGTYRGGGGGLAAWIGYGWWIGSEWSLGALLRLHGVVTRDPTDAGFSVTSSGAVVEASALFH